MATDDTRNTIDTSGDEATNYRFFPIVRRGYRPSATFRTDDAADGALESQGRTTIEYTAEVVEGPDAGDESGEATESVDLSMYGPGDVTGLEDAEVVRTEPEPGSSTTPPNYFPFVEFQTPDLPWLFSPVQADDEGRSFPWLALVAVAAEDAELSRTAEAPNPALEVAPGELPPIEDAWAWAHAQVTGSPAADPDVDAEGEDALEEAFTSRSDVTASRLVCPRNLDPNTTYLAAVVPTFEAGRAVGLGEEPSSHGDEDGDDESPPETELAWPDWETARQQDGATIRLPVYHHWEFTTAERGDFEYLVRKLEPRDLAGNEYSIGYREVNVTDPGPEPLDFDDSETHTVRLGGALQAEQCDDWWWYERSDELRQILNAPTTAVDAATEGYEVVGPPIYGQWHSQQIFEREGAEDAFLDLSVDEGHPALEDLDDDAMRWCDGDRVDAAAIEAQYGGYGPLKPMLSPSFEDDWDLRWLYDLNLTPSFRLAASIGAKIVQEQQENLMTSAWEQVGEVREANRQLAAAQLSRGAMSKSVERLFHDDYPVERLFQVTGPAHDRLFVDDRNSTVAEHVEESDLPSGVLSPAFRRLTSPAGRLSQRLASDASGKGIVSGLLDGNLDTSVGDGPSGLVGVEGGPDAFDALCADAEELDEEPVFDSSTDLELSDAAYLRSLFCPRSFDIADPVPPDRTAIDRAWTPIESFVDRVLGRLGAPGLRRRGDPLDTIMAYPEFPQPMSRDLKEVSEEYLLPGVEEVPENTLGALMTNRRFVESFLVGLNHEMASELLWRRYPTDRSGSHFKRFWDQRSRIPKPEDEDKLDDVIPLHRWDDKGERNVGNSPLGSNVRTGETDEEDPPDERQFDDGEDADPDEISPTAVLLLRGELLERYPNTTIYAAKACDHDGDRVPAWATSAKKQSQVDTNVQKFPTFRGDLDPDITFFGFDLTVAQARGDDEDDEGWFFVLSEPPGEPRFGLDVGQDDDPDGPPFGVAPGEDDPPVATAEEVDEGVERGWAGLSWAHLPSDQQDDLTYVDVGEHAPGAEDWAVEAGIQWGPEAEHTFDADQAATWGKNSAHMAYITWQKPVRIAVHADDVLLPEDTQ